MRKQLAVGCALTIAACRGSNGAKQDSVPHDATPIQGAPAISTPATPSLDSAIYKPRKAPSAKSTNAETRVGRGATTGGGATVTPTTVSVSDTVRGIISVTGTDRDHHVMIAPAGGGRRIEITGPTAPLIGHTSGADVWVSGLRAGTSLQAERFVVRTVDGSPALDGTLKTEGSTLYIVTDNGARTRIVSPPPPLIGHDGARVWITGDPAKGVASFGFIDPPR